MSPDELSARLTTILRDVFDDDTLVAEPSLSADELDDWDSFSHVRLIAAVERSFEIRFAAAEVASLRNVGDLSALIAAKVPR